MAITMAEANSIVAGAIAEAESLGIKISAAVVDSGGRLVAFNRMDGAIWGGVYGSQGKAVASAGFARSSGLIQQNYDTSVTLRGIVAAEGHMIPGQGAVPIMRDGACEGACGVGGGTAQQDEDCANAGVGKL